MPTNSAFDAYFKSAAARLSQNKTIAPQSNPWANYKPIAPKVTTPVDDALKVAGNLGQGLLDFLSTGTYAVAGIGNRVGESVGKLAQGDFSNVIQDIIPGYNVLAAANQGIQEKRTWSENLTDLGADEGTSTWAGLALDIVLDPVWLIPGGAIGKGITGTARGIGEASRLTKEGVQLTPEIMKGVQAATADATRPGLRNLPKVTGEYGILSDVLKPSGQKISVASPQGLQNFALGIKQANIENYAEWSAARAERKRMKALKKQGGFERVIEDIAADSDKFKTEVPVGNVADEATDAVVKIVEDKATTKIPDEIKDVDAAEDLASAAVDKVKPAPAAKTPKAKAAKVVETVIEDVQTASSKRLQKRVLDYVEERGGGVQEIGQTDLAFSVARKYNNNVTDATADKYWAAIYDLEQQGLIKFGKDYANPIIETAVKVAPKAGSVYSKSRLEMGPARTGYQKANGFDTTEINYAAIKAADNANEMGRTYDNLVSDPTNPAVISAYTKLVEESRRQYDYMVNDLGIKIEYVTEDPYNIVKAGESVPSSKLMMEDVLNNRTLKVRDSAIDFGEFPHPLLTVDENNIFRAVHDFFGHAASGRGFLADGEEAAWVSHSSMFTPEARRAMSTETRGQNSWRNAPGLGYNEKTKKYSYPPQKAALFPEEYTLLPAELDLVTGQALTANAFFGRLTSALSLYADNILDDLLLVKTPVRGEVLYTADDIVKIKAEVEKVIKKSTYKTGTPEHSELLETLREIVNRLESAIPESVAFLEKPKDITTLKLLQQTLDTSVDVTPLLQALTKAEGRTLTPPPAFKPTKWEATKGKPAFKIEALNKYFPNDELLSDPKKLGIAMGTTSIEKAKIYTRKGETAAQAYARYQATIWDDFRARNLDEMKTVEATEKAAWNAKYGQENNEMFTETNGQLVGLGNLPENLPMGVLTGSFNGQPMSTLGKMLENIGSMITDKKLSPFIAKFMSSKFREAFADVKSNGVKIADMSEKEFNAAASKLLSTGVVKTYADAVIAVGGKAEDIRKLGAKPKMRIYINNRDSLRKISKTGKGQFLPLLRRDPATGAPVDKLGNIVTERNAAKLDVSNMSDAGDNFVGLRGAPLPTMRRITDKGTPFTGRSGKEGSAWAEQSGVDRMQLADLQAVREAIGNIGAGIKAKEFIAMPEQAALLSNVMTSIGIKVADNIAPEAVFKQFQKEALPAFNDMIKKIESAAKSEAVIYQARAVFNRSIEENMSLMKAIEAADPGDVQRSVVKFTEDAVDLVDVYCATRFNVIGGPKTTGTEFLQNLGVSKGATDDGIGTIRETLAAEYYPNDLSKAVKKSEY